MKIEDLATLPKWLKGVLVFGAGGGIVGLLRAFDSRLAMIAVTGLLVMGLSLAIFRRFTKAREKRQGAAMSGQIQDHSSSAPAGISEPAKRARLDDMKRNFGVGLDKFRSAGKDVYQLPWYLIVGEPGSGKTEAIRRCSVGFPPGLQDELQGVGGTINMNWWFTNQAVMLDTAGRLMFEEVKPGETSEWREFLGLLKRNRPSCPVNGLFLVIPAESLIRDTTEQISRKAGKIAQQLDIIQRTLDVRFPVFILVTKCDLLNGFREFFEDMDDPQAQHQMLGWSNPEPRDTVFKPELVTEHLDKVVDRIRKRRFGLIRDPSPHSDNGKRADEVDSLFGLPQSLSLIGPRLRSYLSTVFVAGEWSAKPLFLRGIYFTSAMREGAALDQELAEALGVSMDELPDGKAWERERAYFLRDLFVEKAFNEKGLVTKATDTKSMLRKRQFILYSCGLGALLLLLGLTYFGYLALKASVGQQSQYWARGKEDWNAGVWHPIVEHDVRGAYVYKGDQQAFPDDKVTLIDYHEKIRALTTENISVNWIFRPLAQFAGLQDRAKAQRILLEGSVVGPLVTEARRAMVDERRSDAGRSIPPNIRLVRDAEAIAALIRIESDTAVKNPTVDTIPAEVITPLLRYSTGQEKPYDDKTFKALAETMVWTYSKNPEGFWPPKWLSAGNTLAANRPIQVGIDRLMRDMIDNIKTQESRLADLGRLRDQLRAFRKKENDLNTTAISPENREAVYKQMHTTFGELKGVKESLDRVVRDVESRNAIAGEKFTLSKAYEILISKGQNQSKAIFDVLDHAIAGYVEKPSAPVNNDNPIFIEIDTRLKTARTELAKRSSGGLTDQEREELPQLDQLLEDFGNGKRNYEVRYLAYDQTHAQLFVPEPNDDLIGQDWYPLGQLMENLVSQRTNITALHARLAEPFSAAPTYFLDRAEEIRLDRTVKRYIDQTRSKFERAFNYPLVKTGNTRLMTKAERTEAESLIARWRADLSSDNFRRIQSARKAKLEAFLNDLTAISNIIPTLEGTVTLNFLSYTQTPDKGGLNHFRKVVLDGKEYDTSADRIAATYGFFDTISADFVDYSVTPRKTSPYRSSVLDLLAKTRSGQNRLSLTVDGFPIWIEVSADRQPPDLSNLPDKQRVLSSLN